MKFIQDLGKDLKHFMASFGKEQIGLARFGDGEERMYMGGTYHCSDGWVSKPDKNSKLRKALAESIRYSHPRYYVGMRWPRGLKTFCWTVDNVKTPTPRLFDPCLFVNSRYNTARKFFLRQRPKCFLVGSGEGVDFRIPHNCITPEYNWAKLLKTLLTTKKNILLAAGPLANVLVMEYLRAGGKRSIIDIGTVLDFELFGKSTRGYMRSARAKMAKRSKRKAKKAKAVRKPKAKKVRAARPPKKKKRVGRRPMGAVRAEAHLKKMKKRAKGKK